MHQAKPRPRTKVGNRQLLYARATCWQKVQATKTAYIARFQSFNMSAHETKFITFGVH
jgi:hypothetical protein